jgi:protein-disulfide isomerase
MARTIGLDLKRFQADWDSAETKKIVAKDMDDGDHAFVEGTPSIYINGQKYNGSLELAAIRPYLDAELKKTK